MNALEDLANVDRLAFPFELLHEHQFTAPHRVNVCISCGRHVAEHVRESCKLSQWLAETSAALNPGAAILDGLAPCEHCGGSLAKRNPSGGCDHRHYPDNCLACSERESRRQRKRWRSAAGDNRIIAIVDEFVVDQRIAVHLRGGPHAGRTITALAGTLRLLIPGPGTDGAWRDFVYRLTDERTATGEIVATFVEE